jgi:hypothetical protein
VLWTSAGGIVEPGNVKMVAGVGELLR